jgi:mannose-1-phosphate guanylyltransferase
MRAMVLCAGLGTRLRPLTETWPKPAIPFLGQPLLRCTLGLLAKANISQIAINVHHLPDVMAQVAEEECRSLSQTLHVSREDVLLGTGGGIRNMKRFVAGDECVVINGDILFAFDLQEALAAHRARGALATLLLLPMPENERYASVDINPEGWVGRIAGHGPGGDHLSPWHFTGAHILSPEIFDFMAPSGPEDINRDVYPRALAAGRRIYGHAAKASYWSDLGTPARYAASLSDFLLGSVDASHFGRGSPFEGATKVPGGYCKGKVHLAGHIRGPAYLADCEVEAGAEIGEGVFVSRGAKIGSGARIVRSAIFDGTRIGAEALSDCLAFGAYRIRAR